MNIARPSHRLFALGTLLLFGLVISPVASAQTGNLLTNPGFEPPYSTVDGDPQRQVAQGWLPWNSSASDGLSFSDNVQPEYYPASNTTDGMGNANIRSGSDAQQYFTYYATHTAGVYQAVSNATAGTEYTFSVYAYVWSTALDDPAVSANDGGLIVQVGIDPAGGTDGESADIVWSPAGAPIYDAFTQYSVTATASAETITVWVRSVASAPVRVNAVYVDDASLTAAGADATVIPPSSVPATNSPVPATATTAASATALPTNTTVPASATVAPTNTEAVPTSAVPPTETVVPSETPIPASPTPIPTVDNVVYPGRIVVTVEAGDSVASIAEDYGSSINAILAVNNLTVESIILVGQQLIVPVPLPYTPPAGATSTSALVIVTTTPIATSPAGAATATSNPPAPQPGGTYVVQFGDTLFVIAVRNGTTVNAVAALNGIVNPNLIYIGQRLILPATTVPPTAVPATSAPPVATAITIPELPVTPTAVPAPRTYRVQYGDNLYIVAIRFRVTVRSLIQANNLQNPNLIYAGQLLVIP